MVFVQRPVCPRCGALGYHRLRSEASGDGSVTKRVVCRGCARKYLIVVELPETGKIDSDPGIITPGRKVV
jgi:hypothetical protein